MNNFDFDKSRSFLEYMIDKNPENKELIQVYVKLIEKKTEFDIAYFNGDAELRKDWEKNQTERIKADSEITKKSIEKGAVSKAECNTVNESTLGHYHSAPALLA